MKSSLSLFAATLALMATTAASAATAVTQAAQDMDVPTDQAMEGSATLSVMVQWADGSTSVKSERFRSQPEAIEAYQKWVQTLPEGARMIRAEINGPDGHLDLNAQG